MLYFMAQIPHMRLLISLFSLLPLTTMAQSPKAYHLLVGAYSKAIHVCRFDPASGNISQINKTEGLDNPSFLIVSPNGQYVYAVSEAGKKEGGVYAFTFNKTSSKLTLLNKQPSGGTSPCHISMDKAGRYVIVSNYGNGSVSVLPILEDGSLGAPVQTIQHTGSGPVESRQKGPHAHSATFSPDEKQVFVADLGIDKIMVYDYDPENKQPPLTPAAIPFIVTPPGMGPRHFTFHPNGKYAYAVGELRGNVTSYQYKDKTLTLLQSVSTSPWATPKFSLADVHISPDGNFLYVSDRDRQNYLVIFTINNSNGELRYLKREPTLGESPRNFIIGPSGKFVLVANQASNNIIAFKRDAATGTLSRPGNQQFNIPAPSCLQLIPIE